MRERQVLLVGRVLVDTIKGVYQRRNGRDARHEHTLRGCQIRAQGLCAGGRSRGDTCKDTPSRSMHHIGTMSNVYGA